jgi:hypothetical protein
MLSIALIVMMFALAQSFGSGGWLTGNTSAQAATVNPQRSGSSVYQHGDNDDGDNVDAADDNDNVNDTADDNDNDVDDIADDNDNDADDDDTADSTPASSSSTVAASPVNEEALKQPLQQVSGTSNGGDSLIAMPGERVAIRMFPWMPAGVQVTIRPVDPNTVAAAPGTRAGDLVFVVEAKDASGTQLSALPSEVNLAIRYADSTVSGLNEGNLTLSRLDPITNQWQTAPKIVREPDSNYLAASVSQLGTYVVSAN